MTKQLEKNIYLLDHSEKNILVHPRNPAPPPRDIKWWSPNVCNVLDAPPLTTTLKLCRNCT